MRILLVLAIAILMCSAVYGIGIRPSSMVIEYEPGKSVDYEFEGENRDNFDVNVKIFMTGELSDYASFTETTSVIQPKSKKTFKFNIQHPADLEPGTHSGRLYIEETATPEEFLEGGSGFGAKGAVIMHVSLKVPYPGKYLEVSFPPMRVISPGESIFFTLNAVNYGGETLQNVNGRFKIFSEDGSLITTIDSTVIDSISPGEKSDLRAIWQVPEDAVPGPYKILAEIDYGGENPATATYNFQVGAEYVAITDANVIGIQQNSVAKALIDVKSEWNKEIEDVYAEIEISHEGQPVDSIKTSSENVPPMARDTLTAYWEVGEQVYDEYKGLITLHHSGKQVEQAITFGPEKDAEFEKTDYPLELVAVIFASLAVLALSLFFLFRMKKR